MLEIENFRSLQNVTLKKSNIIVMTGDNYTLLNDICYSFEYYFNNKKLLKTDKEINEGKLTITDLSKNLKKNVSSVSSILINCNDFNTELDLGTKSKMYDTLTYLFNEKLSINPVLMTINSLLEDLELDSSFLKFKNKLSSHSNIKIDIKLNKFIANDFIKKIDIILLNNDEEINPYLITPLEKIKLQLAISETNDDICNTTENKIFIFPFPENNLSTKEIYLFNKFIKNISKEHTILIATFSKDILTSIDLDNLNIFINNDLKNNIATDDVIELLYNNYPLLKEKEYISMKLNFISKHFLSSTLYGELISNKYLDSTEYVFIENFENIFILLFFLKLSNINYNIDLEYDDSSPFSNYIKDNF